MAITPTITTSLARICQYLVGNDNEVRKGMFNGTINDKFPMILYMERKAIDYGIQQSLSNLQGNTNYLYSLLGGQIQKANNILTNGGGGVNVSSVVNSYGSLMPFPVSHIVTSSEAGVSTISDNSWKNLAYINTAVINNSTYQIGVGFTFNAALGQFDFGLSGYILQEGDYLSALGFLPISSSGTSTATTITEYKEATAGTSIIMPNTINKNVLLVLRGGVGRELISSGTPTDSQILFTAATGTFSVASGNDFFDGEIITVQYIN